MVLVDAGPMQMRWNVVSAWKTSKPSLDLCRKAIFLYD